MIFKKAYKVTAKRFAQEMQMQLRANAIQDRWDPKVASGLTVQFNNGNLATGHRDEDRNAVFDLENGTQDQVGKATIRRLGNNKAETVDRFARLYKKATVKEAKKK
ncbi:hypothetical protein UFOVP111_81 [uncultured Caudovirales phage]|uniref:Uncharacterized protein n=1 Tax=uncultured Caudovirales phage TaxID=2100421 RepID=A0A6J5L5I5_9CAUD|nr:hypothetical protein UFOVP111_81 [uncultured Caudovirales phage]